MQRPTNSNGLKVKIFGSTSISGYTDRVDEICAWLEAWKTDIWEGRGQWCARRHLSNDPCFLCLVLGMIYLHKRSYQCLPHIIIPKKTESYRTSTCLSFLVDMSFFFSGLSLGFVLQVYFQIFDQKSGF